MIQKEAIIGGILILIPQKRSREFCRVADGVIRG